MLRAAAVATRRLGVAVVVEEAPAAVAAAAVAAAVVAAVAATVVVGAVVPLAAPAVPRGAASPPMRTKMCVAATPTVLLGPHLKLCLPHPLVSPSAVSPISCGCAFAAAAGVAQMHDACALAH